MDVQHESILKMNSNMAAKTHQALNNVRMTELKSFEVVSYPKQEERIMATQGMTKNDKSSDQDSPGYSLFQKLGSALFYGGSSFLLIVINKYVLTVHAFPSFLMLGVGQMLASIVVLAVLKAAGQVNYPNFQRETFWKIYPLPLIYLGNMLFGLGGTQAVSLPMMVVLRKFTLLMTMIAEIILLNYKPTKQTKISIFVLIFGAFVAAINDLGFNMMGYVYVLSCDFFTAAYIVYLKVKLIQDELGKYGLLYYNSLYMILPTLLLAASLGELEKTLQFEEWTNPIFCFEFFLSCIFGFILMYSMLVCNHFNTPLTTMITGSAKNIISIYVGMLIGGDYVFSWPNVTGLTITVFGVLWYTKATLEAEKEQKRQTKIAENDLEKGDREISTTKS